METDDRASLTAIQDQLTGALVDSEGELAGLGEATAAAAKALLARGMEPHQVVSNLTGFVAAHLFIGFTRPRANGDA